jgi:CHAT domain-containing protein
LRAEYTAWVARNAEIRGTSRALVGMTRPGATEIRRSLRAGEVMLEYMVTPDRLLIFVVTPDTMRVHSVEEGAERLTSRVQLARELLRKRDGEEEAQGVLRALFDIVLGPAEQSGALREAKRLIVVPHGILTYLPFAALADSAGYVAERFVLLHLPTSAALPALRTPESSTRPLPAAAVFAPIPRALPATRGEAQAVARVLAGAETHIGSRATERRFRAALQRGGIVHVASHATLNSRNPLFSHIELAGKATGVSIDNGRLEAHELLGLRIDAALVFLSGCETAMGGSAATSANRATAPPPTSTAASRRALSSAASASPITSRWSVRRSPTASSRSNWSASCPRR